MNWFRQHHNFYEPKTLMMNTLTPMASRALTVVTLVVTLTVVGCVDRQAAAPVIANGPISTTPSPQPNPPSPSAQPIEDIL